MSQLSQIEMNMIMNGKMKESIYKRLEEIGLYSYDVGNRRKWYYSNPDLQNNGYVEEENEIQVVFVDWMGSLTEMWVKFFPIFEGPANELIDIKINVLIDNGWSA